MKILLVADIFEYGAVNDSLASFVQALLNNLKLLGYDIRLVIPEYKDSDLFKKEEDLYLDIPTLKTNFRATRSCLDNIPVYLIKKMPSFEGCQIEELKDIVFFNRAVLSLLESIDWKPDLIHCHNWQTALIPVYIKNNANDNSAFNNIATILTIQTLEKQGTFAIEQYLQATSSKYQDIYDQIIFKENINILKGGIVCSDTITVPSPTYSKEIQTKEYGLGLEDILSENSQNLIGILNGLDYDLWNPENDKNLISNYSPSKLIDKRPNKENLQRSLGLPVDLNIPVLAMDPYLKKQEGFNLINNTIDTILKLNIQFVAVINMDSKYRSFFEETQKKHPQKFAIFNKENSFIPAKLYAGVDIWGIPSLYDPCRNEQLINLRYGTIPIVKKTGSLNDIIVDYEKNKRSGNGFVFDDPEIFIDTVEKAISTFHEKTAWTKLMHRGMELRFSWEKTTKAYSKLYKRVINRKKKSF